MHLENSNAELAGAIGKATATRDLLQEDFKTQDKQLKKLLQDKMQIEVQIAQFEKTIQHIAKQYNKTATEAEGAVQRLADAASEAADKAEQDSEDAKAATAATMAKDLAVSKPR